MNHRTFVIVTAIVLPAFVWIPLNSVGLEAQSAQLEPLPFHTEIVFRDLAENPPREGKHALLARDTVTTTTLRWREDFKRKAIDSEYAEMTLPRLIDVALEYNYSLRNSERDVARSKSIYREAKAKYLPFVNLASSSMYTDSKVDAGPALNKTKTFVFGGEVNLIQNLPTGGSITASGTLDKSRAISEIPSGSDLKATNYGSGIDLRFTQPLLRGAGPNIDLANVRISRLREISSELQDYRRRRDTVLDVIGRFYEIVFSISNIEISQAALEVNQKAIKDAEVFYELGWSIPNEISLARVQYHNEELRLLLFEQQLQDRIQGLLEVLGLPMTTPISFRELSGGMLDAALAGIPDRETAVREAIANRPELLETSVDIRMAEIGFDVAKNDTLPDLDFTASYRDNEFSPDLGRAMDLDKHRTWDAGLALSIPLPNIARKETRRRSALDLESARTNHTIIERSIIREVDSLLRQLERSDESIQVLARTVAQAKFSFEQELEQFKYGQNTSNKVRDAQDDYFKAQADYNGEILLYQRLIAQLYGAMGWALY